MTRNEGCVVSCKMRNVFLLVMLSCALFLSIPSAYAQASGDISFGLGGVHDKATGNGLTIDVNDNLDDCSPVDASAGCVGTSHLSGVMMGFSGNYMINRRFGAGADVTFQPSKQNYANIGTLTGTAGEEIQSRLTFYDFNGVYQPVKTKLAAVQVLGGFGGANVKFYDSVSSSGTLGSANSSTQFSSANHFQLHAGVGVPIYFAHNFFVRPQFDIHYVHNFNQYGADLVTQGMVWIGYKF